MRKGCRSWLKRCSSEYFEVTHVLLQITDGYFWVLFVYCKIYLSVRPYLLPEHANLQYLHYDADFSTDDFCSSSELVTA